MKLSTNHIVVSDLDTPRKDLLVWLVTPPKYGHIENTKKGEAWLAEGQTHGRAGEDGKRWLLWW